MKAFFALLFSALWVSAANPASDMKLSFSDDFESGKVDETKWVLGCDAMMISFPKVGRSTALRISAVNKKRNSVSTSGKFEQMYGYFEASMRMPPYNARVSCRFSLPPVGSGEKDVPNIQLLWDASGADLVVPWARMSLTDGQHDLRPDGKLPKVLKPKESYEKFNTYGFLWTEKAYVWFINGKKVHQLDKQNVAKPLRVAFDVTPDSPANEKLKPQMLDDSVDIDWVKVWK